MKVSVYCLVYNHGKYLKSALDGFVNQKVNFPFEVIVHDDCSTDNSAIIIKEYADKYPDIIKPIYQRENQYSKGISIKRTYIAPLVKGDYVAVCEGDDYWNDELKLQKQVDFLDNNLEYIACVHDTLQENQNDGTTFRMFNFGQDKDINLEDILKGKCFHTSSVLYRSKMIYSYPPFYEAAKSFGDVQLAIDLSLNGKIKYFDTVMSVYRHGTVGSWSYRNECDFQSRASSYKSYMDMLISVNEYTDYKYAKIVDFYIDKYDINRLSFEEDYSNLFSRKYINIFNKLSTREKFAIIYRTIFRKFYIRNLDKKRREYEKIINR